MTAPKVGDPVNYWPHAELHDTEGAQPHAAWVAQVLPQSDGNHAGCPHVNVGGFAPDGTHFSKTSIPLLGLDDPLPQYGAFARVPG